MARLEHVKIGRRKALAGGILMNAYETTISGARVKFDPRRMADVNETRSDVNQKANQKGMRKRLWEIKQAEKARNKHVQT
jgi:hypothetical protein